MSRFFSAIVLIGMSGVGKTTHAEKYGEKATWADAKQKIGESGNFLYISADTEIFFRLKDKGELSEPASSPASSLASSPISSDESVDLLAEYVGKFGGEKTREEFFRRQKLYSEAEEEDLRALPCLLRSACEEHSRFSQPILYDTTGSFCEVLKDRTHPLYQEIGEHACFVYLACSEHEEQILLQRQMERPKPMVYDKGCFDGWWEEYKKQESQMEGEIVSDDFLRFIFPKAIKYRRARYEELADVTLTTDELEVLAQGSSPPMFAKAFVNLVKDKLSDKELSASRAQQEVA